MNKITILCSKIIILCVIFTRTFAGIIHEDHFNIESANHEDFNHFPSNNKLGNHFESNNNHFSINQAHSEQSITFGSDGDHYHKTIEDYMQPEVHHFDSAPLHGSFDDTSSHGSDHHTPQDTPEVEHAKLMHFIAHEEAKKGHAYTITPEETHEVQIAKAKHLEAVEEAKKNKFHYTITPVETPEVQHARLEHMEAHEKAKGHQEDDTSGHYRRKRELDFHGFDSGHHGFEEESSKLLEGHEFNKANAGELLKEDDFSGKLLEHYDFSGSGLEHHEISGSELEHHGFSEGSLESHDLGGDLGGFDKFSEGNGLESGLSHGLELGSHSDLTSHGFGSSSFDHGGLDSHSSTGYTLIHNGKHPVDTPEVEKAKALHLAAHHKNF